jgi:hypothetical protein
LAAGRQAPPIGAHLGFAADPRERLEAPATKPILNAAKVGYNSL